MQFDRLVQGPDAPRTLIMQTDVAQLTLTRHGNVVSCVCELSDPSDEGYEALRRRGAVDDTFMISPKLQPREFGIWLERLLTETGNHCFGKLLRAHLLLTRVLAENIVGVDAILDGLQPGVVNQFGDIGLADVNQHEHGTEQQSRGVR